MVGPYGHHGAIPFNHHDGGYTGVRAITVVEYVRNITYIGFDYMRGNQIVRQGVGEPPRQGNMGDQFVFVLDVGEEYLKSVEGTYAGGDITSLIFKTSTGRTSQVFGRKVGTSFILEKLGFEIVDFFGSYTQLPYSSINSLGAHLVAAVIPLQADGIIHDNANWDDGVHGHVYEIEMSFTQIGIGYIKFTYADYVDDNWDIHEFEHGMIEPQTEKFILYIPDEYIIAVDGRYSPFGGLTMLRFTTNIQTSQVFGHDEDGEDEVETIPFHLEQEGFKIVGFFVENNFGVYLKLIDEEESDDEDEMIVLFNNLII